MENFLRKILPKEYTDIFTYYLIAVALLPFIYLMFGQRVNYMIFNTFLLFLFGIILIFYLVSKIIKKRLINYFKSPAFCLLFAMFLWIFVSAFFSFNQEATWFGMYKGYHGEESVWQYLFYFSIAFSVILLKKENIKYILSVFIIIACLIIFMQFVRQDYGFVFIHKNHTGYYLCMTLMISVGMFMYSKKIIPAMLSFLSMLMHFISLVLNGSMGPIIGILTFFIVGIIYIAIHKRSLFVKILSVLACFVVVISIFDYVPRVKDLRDEEATTIEKVVGIGIITLNKLGIITEEDVKNAAVAPGSDGYGRFGMWKRAYENMLEFPFFGLGSGSWKSYNEDMPNMKPHNEFLQYGVTGGFPALLFYISLLGYLFICFRKKHKKMTDMSFVIFAALVVYLIQSIFGNVMPFTSPLFYVLLGIAIVEIDCDKIKKDNKKEDEILIESEKLLN